MACVSPALGKNSVERSSVEFDQQGKERRPLEDHSPSGHAIRSLFYRPGGGWEASDNAGGYVRELWKMSGGAGSYVCGDEAKRPMTLVFG